MMLVFLLLCGNAVYAGTTMQTATVIGEYPYDSEVFTISAGGSNYYWKITPLRTADFTFWTTGTGDDYGTLYDAAGSQITANDDISVVTKAIRKLGYDLADEDIDAVFAEVKNATAKKNISAKELDAIVATTALQVPPSYTLVSYVINAGNTIGATASMEIEYKDEEVTGVARANGPIGAAFMAIEQIIGHHYELDDFQIQSITEGREAMGEALVRLRADDGRLYSGRGISTDIIGASIRAYISAVNKIVFEQ